MPRQQFNENCIKGFNPNKASFWDLDVKVGILSKLTNDKS